MAFQCTFDHSGRGPRCCVESEDGVHGGPHLFKCAGVYCPGLMWPASVMSHPVTCTTAGATRKPLGLSGWYEHMDGSWGFYTWEVAAGVVSLVCIVTVRTFAETAGPGHERVFAMRETLLGRRDRESTEGASWCTLALHGHDIAIAKVIMLDRQLAAEVVQQCPHGNMPREAGAGHGCHLDPDTKGTP